MHFATDAHYEKGSTHAVCQDYACAVRCSSSLVAAVVCDGCSNAPDSDIGARILAHAFLQEATGEAGGLRDRVASRLVRGLRQLGLPGEAGQATVVGWIVNAETGVALGYVWGDGYLAVRRGDDVEAWFIRHPHGAPPYLGYWTVPALLKSYADDASFGLGLSVEHVAADGTSRHTTVQGWWETQLPIGDTPVSLVAGSDGAMSFWGGGAVLPAMDVVRELTAFRDADSGFVLRRMRRQLHQWGRRETPFLPADDVATAAIQVSP